MVYYRNPTTQEVFGYDQETQKELIREARAAGWPLVQLYPPPPTPEEMVALCRKTASTLLAETDWTTIPDVANSANNPHLTNQAEYFAYRNILRGYAVNPIANPTWPDKPKSVWGTN